MSVLVRLMFFPTTNEKATREQHQQIPFQAYYPRKVGEQQIPFQAHPSKVDVRVRGSRSMLLVVPSCCYKRTIIFSNSLLDVRAPGS